jgi:hypothetical protein
MSVWYEIEDQEDVELSEDGGTLEIKFNIDDNGSVYVEVPIKIIKKALEK